MSDIHRRGRGRRLAGVVLVVLLVGLSGYMASGGVTVDLSIGGGADASTAAVSASGGAAGDGGLPAENGSAVTASARGSDRPAGFVGDGGDTRGPDVDRDGITNRAEREIYGTDPNARDTDGDGIPDGVEIACSAAYPGADPLHQDVYLELDSVDGAALSTESVERLEEAFADAPVENPDGESGIDLHVVRSDDGLPEGDAVNDDPRPGAYNDVEDYRTQHFQHRAAGYYYVLVATDAAYDGDPYYAGAGHPGVAIVESYDRDGVMTSLLMHELGHAFGIDGSADGVDGREYSRTEYTSVMNYNVLYELTTYSDGTDEVRRDEWAYVADDRHTPPIETGRTLCPTVG